MELKGHLTFGDSGLDRATNIRSDAKQLNALFKKTKSGVLAIWRGKPLICGRFRDTPGWLNWSHEVFKHAVGNPIFLGIDDGIAKFAIDVSDWLPEESLDTVGAFLDPSEQHYNGMGDDYGFIELRSIMVNLSARDAELLSTAKALSNWHRENKYCSSCGAESVSSSGGWQRDCGSCQKHQFPRTDPVVIMLVTNGNSVLMGRSYPWPKGMYSLLAGFVEPGETIEAAVKRETLEEVGVRVGQVDYLCSQPWPFPASLMIGCRGYALSSALDVDKNELEDAKWISREKMLRIFNGENPDVLPSRKGSIANFLLKNWLNGRLI